MREPLSIIIPTFNNETQLNQCVQSLSYAHAWYPLDIIIINNGSGELSFPEFLPVRVFNTGENLGWEGGLLEGLKHTENKYVVFMNDDTYLPKASYGVFREMVRMMEMYPKIGAMGPSSNVVMSYQNIWAEPQYGSFTVPFLIGYCVLLRRTALDGAGGVDDTAPGGDDIDLSIRLREKGYDLVCYKEGFVYHHGFQTGTRIHGNSSEANGWNSKAMTERTNDWLIRKHGFLTWWKTMVASSVKVVVPSDEDSDIEGRMILSYIRPDVIVELGCGAKKTVPEAIGVDEVPKGQPILLLGGNLSVADIVADVTDPLPFEDDSVDTLIARHILEHIIPSVKVLKQWKRILREGGRIIIACPNENITETIPLNPEHVAAYTPETLTELVELIGFKVITTENHVNGVSFILVAERIS
jgi:GT2 family glycosyltransferase